MVRRGRPGVRRVKAEEEVVAKAADEFARVAGAAKRVLVVLGPAVAAAGEEAAWSVSLSFMLASPTPTAHSHSHVY